MALSMDEQRILDEMERKLADDDPRLASRLASFGGPALSAALRSPRARMLICVATLAAVAVVALMVYSMMPFRAAGGRHAPAGHPTASPRVTGPAKVQSSAGTPAAKVSRAP